MTRDVTTTGFSRSRLAVFVCVVTVLACIGIGGGWGRAAEAGKDVTQHVENLGNPFSEMRGSWLRNLYRQVRWGPYRPGEWTYARNIWDMHVYDGRVYLGAGNSSDGGPVSNAGPVPIVCYDPAIGDFVKEGTVQDEQIDAYYTHRGRLYIPGHDPMQSWDWGNLYCRQDDGRWKKHRNIPDAIHLYAVAWHNGKLFGGLGTPREKGGAAVCISADDGKTWTIAQTGKYRVYDFLAVAGSLYAVETIPGGRASSSYVTKWLGGCWVYEYIGPDRFVPRKDITAATLFPQTNLRPYWSMKAVRVHSLKDESLYIGAAVHNDHQFLPFGLYVASSLQEGDASVRRIELPDHSRPWDLLVRDDGVYVLLESPADADVEVKVLRSKGPDLNVWDEVLHFSSPTFARSFEKLDGDFYFGLGCEVENPREWKDEELHPATGDILRVRAAFVGD